MYVLVEIFAIFLVFADMYFVPPHSVLFKDSIEDIEELCPFGIVYISSYYRGHRTMIQSRL